MRDFRLIKKFEGDWKDSQRELEKAKEALGQASLGPKSPMEGGGVNLEELLDELADIS